MKPTFEMIHKISAKLGEEYRGKITNIGGAVIATAYVLSKIQQTPLISINTIESFLDGINENEAVSTAISRNLDGLWEIVVSFIGKYDTDVLEALVLYDNSYFEMSTPPSLVKLAMKILDIREQDTFFEICSGCATFPTYAHLFGRKINDYTGIEINYNLNDIAILRASLLDNSYTLVLSNALTYQYSKSFDKIFANYPFGMRGSDLDECRYKLQKHYKLNSSSIARCSSDWIFNATIVRNLNKTGKAVAIMTNGATFNKPDLLMRQFFAENGYIESIINLPPSLFIETAIPVTMIVFSYNNNSIRLVDAENIFSKTNKRLNILSDENVQKIFDCINHGGENTIDLFPKDMRNHDYNLMASHYLEKPNIEDGICFNNIIKSITRGAQIKSELLDSYKAVISTNYRYITLSNVSNGLINIEEGQQYIKELPKSLEKFVVPNNAIVLSKMASPTFRSAIVNTKNEQSIIATGNLYIIEIDESKANPYYVQAFFDSVCGETILNYISSGSIVKTISADAVKNLIIPLPPLEKQNRIALKYQATLDEYAILKRKIQRVLEKKRKLLDSEV